MYKGKHRVCNICGEIEGREATPEEIALLKNPLYFLKEFKNGKWTGNWLCSTCDVRENMEAKKGIKSNKEWSFRRLVDEGKSKEEICKLKKMSPEAYEKVYTSLMNEKVYTSLMKNREEKRKAIESKKVKVMIAGHNGLYRIDMESREFRSMDNPEHYIPYENVPFEITAFTCQHCESLINNLDYKEQGTFSLQKGLAKDDYVPEKTEFSCPLCHAPFNKDVLRTMGAQTV